jgi:hypothetical protein
MLKVGYTGRYLLVSSKLSSRTLHKRPMRLLPTKVCAMLMQTRLEKLQYLHPLLLKGAFQDPRIVVLSVMRACMTFLMKRWYSAKNVEMPYIWNASNNVCRFCCSLCPLSSLLSVASLTGRRSAAQLTCVWCRAKWQRGGKTKDSASPASRVYVNLGEVAGLSGERDTSTCMWRHSLLPRCPKIDASSL